MRAWTSNLANPFTIDLRALATMRVMVAVALLADLMIRGADFSAWMTSSGVLPRNEVVEYAAGLRFSLYFASDAWIWGAMLFTLAGASAVMLLFGWNTRLATFLSLVMLISLHNRAPMLLQGGDNLLLLLLFWGLFLPLGARWSVDAALAKRPMVENRYVSIATGAILIQAMSVYFFSAFLKSGDAWMPDGTAVYYAINLEHFQTWIATIWADQMWMTRPMTYYVWVLELIGPILIFSPWANLKLRSVFAFLFIALEIGFVFNLKIGLFPLISTASLILFIPKEGWDWLERTLRPERIAGVTLYYDRDCGFCERMCRLLRTFLMLKDAKIAPATDHAPAQALLEQEFSWVVVDPQGRMTTKTAALATLYAHSPLFFWLARPIRWSERLGDRVYRWIGRNRGAVGEVVADLFPYRDEVWRGTRASQAIAGFFVLYIGWWNMSTIPDWTKAAHLDGVIETSAKVPFYEEALGLKHALRLDQRWSMFAPYPATASQWPVVIGMRQDGSIVDVLNEVDGVPSNAVRTSFPSGTYATYRWRKYHERMVRAGDDGFRRAYALWLCRQWNDDAEMGDGLAGLVVYNIVKHTPAPGDEAKIDERFVVEQNCLVDADEDATDRLRAMFETQVASIPATSPKAAGAIATPNVALVPGAAMMMYRGAASE